jgi:hypothetical protein
VHIFAHPIRVEFLFAQFSPYCKAFRGERAVITAKEPLFFSYFHPAEVFGLLFNGEARVFFVPGLWRRLLSWEGDEEMCLKERASTCFCVARGHGCPWEFVVGSYMDLTLRDDGGP